MPTVSRVAGCALDANSDPAPRKRGNLRLVLSGCERLDQESDDIAVSTWRRIAAENPENERALATLAYLEAVRSTYDMTSSGAAALRTAARRHLEKARWLNPQLGMTYAAEAVLIPNSRYRDKLEVLDRGIGRDPDCAVLYAEEANGFQRVGFMNGAVASARKAAELDPGYASRRTALALALAYNGLTDEARNELAAARRVWPDAPALKDAQDRFDYRYGDAAALMQKIERGIEVPYAEPAFAQGIEHSFLMARLHPTPANTESAVRIALKNSGSPAVVQNLVALGRVNRAYAVLNDPSAFALLRENTDVLFRSFMRPFLFDRRFMALAARLGLAQYWLARNAWPSFCADKDIPYDCAAEARHLRAAKAV